MKNKDRKQEEKMLRDYQDNLILRLEKDVRLLYKSFRGKKILSNVNLTINNSYRSGYSNKRKKW